MGGVNLRRRKKLQRQLLEAAGWGTTDQVTALLRAGADPNWPGPDADLPLYRASVQNRPATIRALIAAGADPHLESGHGEEGLPLCAAASWGHDDAVRELLAAGADPHAREDDGHGHTALEWAEAGNHQNTLTLLRDAAR
ncbi:hypothetical protein Acy02nite_83350 [Actinoplanes cyaneus]|uniref:Ankyrin repeat domain-containing protein n=1 Tax=Actinoplanes cyaneus TaxID=52696 RepID=A0A919IQQ3_9ACTN|nr:Ankyrin repeat-containing protein [Actinoplanes cyaneus]GID70454.1 hypothetical protein Acy02nite_83350 [Actinoplanes cyaneus]